jgi:uncharacterized protein YeaC (DUF1315 family)
MFLKGYKMTEEHKRKIGLANSIRLKGKHNSPKTEFKIGSKGHLGYKHSKETKKKMSDRMKERWKDEENRKRQSESHKGKIPGNKGQASSYTGKKHWHWKGGKMIEHNRWFIWKPNHPFCDHHNHVRQSRLVAEQYLNRYLTRQEVIHHIDGNTLNDYPENLYLFPTNRQHAHYESLKNKPILISNII